MTMVAYDFNIDRNLIQLESNKCSNLSIGKPDKTERIQLIYNVIIRSRNCNVLEVT